MASRAKAMILLVTLDKTNLSVGGHYADHFKDPTRFTWQTQTSTRKESERGRIIRGPKPGWSVHIFLRGASAKIRDGKAAPFRYAGARTFVNWTGEAPITVDWELFDPIPQNLRQILRVGS